MLVEIVVDEVFRHKIIRAVAIYVLDEFVGRKIPRLVSIIVNKFVRPRRLRGVAIVEVLQ